MIKDEVLRSFSRKNCLITGGTGLIGRQVVDLLCEAGANVRVVSLDQVKVHPGAEYIIGDLTDLKYCKEISKDMDFVFHLAGIKGSLQVSQTKLASHFVPALLFNTSVLEAARLNNVQKLVFTSSIGAYENADVFIESDIQKPQGPPMDFGGWAKRMAEYQVYAYGVQYGMKNFAIVRPSNVYGPGDNFDPENAMVIPTLLGRIFRKEDPVIVWGDGSAQRDFIYSRDVAEGIILALHHGTQGGYVNLGSGLGTSIAQVVETLHSFITFNSQFDPSKPSGYPKRIMDISKAMAMIEFNPTTTLAEGLKNTWEWLGNNPQEYLKKKNYFKDI